MFATISLIGFGLTWAACMSRRPSLLLPLFVLASLAPAPLALDVVIFPDLGLGQATREFPTCGDVLLISTAVLHPDVARRAFGRGLPLTLILVSLVALSLGLADGNFPSEALILYAGSFIRVALLIALFQWAGRRDPEPARWVTSLFVTLSLFTGAALVYVIGPHVGLQSLVDTTGLVAPSTGRLDFPRLGNNKIGLAMVLLTAAMALMGTRIRTSMADRLLLITILSGLFTCFVADLRFSTTSFGLLLLFYPFSRRNRVPPGVALVVSAGTAALATGATAQVPRAITVLSGDFDLAEDSSLNSRLEMWEGALRIWHQSPLIGELGGWEYTRPVDQLVLLGPLETHSDFVWWLASLGVAGLVILALMLWRPVRAAFRLSMLCKVVVGLSLGALALNSATFFPITGACLAIFIFAGAIAESDLTQAQEGRRPQPPRLSAGRASREESQLPS